MGIDKTSRGISEIDAMQNCFDYQIKVLKKEHKTAVKKILDSQFGQDYISWIELDYFLTPKALGFVAIYQDQILGVSLVKLGNAKSLSNELLKGQDWFLSYFDSKLTLALRQHLAVKSNWQGKGVGSFLLREGMAKLEEKTDTIISVVWQESAGKTLGGLLRKANFFPVKNIKNYWKEDSLIKQYQCPLCPILPCQCSATIFVKNKSITNEI